MRSLLVLTAALVAPSLACADAIMPYDGNCPPGLDRGVAGHAEACIPRACEESVQCGEGAACQPLHECWAEREVPRGRMPGTDRRRVVVGRCDAQRRCPDADASCQTRRRCEPTAPTPAWDRESRRWTGVSHPSPSTRRPVPGAATGCSATQQRSPLPLPLLALALGALVLRASARARASRSSSRSASSRSHRAAGRGSPCKARRACDP